jgi:ACS family tartrate transporter-like MFS transporter
MAAIEQSTLKKVTRRIIPFVGLLYFAAFIDRTNVGFAALQMNRDLGFSAYVYGLGAGIFFAGYCLFEVPSNLILHRFGARRWIARIMITWGILAGAMAFVATPMEFYLVRFLLGVAEAGFFPGIIYYLTHWVPASHRAKLVAAFMTAIPISTAVGGPISGAILSMDGLLGFSGWQWLFLIETIPSLLLGVVVLVYLQDTPKEVSWLSREEREWLITTLERETTSRNSTHGLVMLSALASRRVLALSLCYFGVQFGQYGLILWIPQIVKNLGVGGPAVGFVVAIPYAVAAVGMVLWSRHSDAKRERVGHIAVASILAFSGLAASAFLAGYPTLSVVAITAGAVGNLAILPVFWTMPAAILSGTAAAGGIALINALGNVGGFAGPYVVGWIKDATGSFAYGSLAMAAGFLLTGIIALLIGHDAASEHSRLRPAAEAAPIGSNSETSVGH